MQTAEKAKGINAALGLPRDRMKKVTIAVDVDGTLRCNCTDTCEDPNQRIVDLFNTLASFKNTEMFVWSGGGSDYALRFARKFNLKVKDGNCIDKLGVRQRPDIAIDDIQDTALGVINLIVREK